MEEAPRSPKPISVDESWPLYGLERVPECPVCSSGERELLYRNLTDRAFFTAPGKWALFRCLSCRCAYLDPRPTERTISLAYRHYFTHVQRSRPSVDTLGVYCRIRRALANGYRNARFGLGEEPAHPLGVLAAYVLPGMRSKLDAELRNLPKAQPGQELLDVGCGNGEFLSLARKGGWDVTGVEPDPEAVALCHDAGLRVVEGTIHDIQGECRYDGITMCHVIEHVHDPRKTLTACLRLLKPGGWLWMETPNLNSLGHEKFGKHWLGLDPPRHLVLFSNSALKAVLLETGYSRIQNMPFRPAYQESARMNRLIKEGKGLVLEPYSSSADQWFLSLSEWRQRFSPHIRESIALRAWK